MNLAVWLVFVAAAILEVGGDAVVRRGLRGRRAGLLVSLCFLSTIWVLFDYRPPFFRAKFET